jgi:hypothetical protein
MRRTLARSVRGSGVNAEHWPSSLRLSLERCVAMIRVTSTDGDSWLDVEPLRSPSRAQRTASDVPAFFWGLVTLHLPTDELGGYVAWNQPYLADFDNYFNRLISQPVGEPLLHRTEDDDVTLSALRNEHGDIELTVRLLDWWDPYVAHRRNDPNRELEGRFIATEVAVAAFARQLQRLIKSRS